jgi:hypothetical protein
MLILAGVVDCHKATSAEVDLFLSIELKNLRLFLVRDLGFPYI